MNERYAKCIPFDKNVKGRIGDNPPKCIEGQIPCDYKFYANWYILKRRISCFLSSFTKIMTLLLTTTYIPQ